MNQLVIIVIIAAGMLLIYSAVKNVSPQDVVRGVFGQGANNA